MASNCSPPPILSISLTSRTMAGVLVSFDPDLFRPRYKMIFSPASIFFLSISSTLALKVDGADLHNSSSSEMDRLLVKLKLPDGALFLGWTLTQCRAMLSLSLGLGCRSAGGNSTTAAGSDGEAERRLRAQTSTVVMASRG
ncbi:uncharacterized protein J3R85_009322 [Psidium guajava]|nr:uncharacterized protein J3R85_009322 [Psidium guajava]